MLSQPYVLHALSPLHAGTGQAAELIDLPIARLKGSGIPFVPGSSIKGVLRDARAQHSGVEDMEDIKAVFGPDRDKAGEHAGALVCTDARLLALPVRSFRGTFAFVTSPLLLMLAARDLSGGMPVPALAHGAAAMVGGDTVLRQGDERIYLEDLDLPAARGDPAFDGWADRIAPVFGGPGDEEHLFRRRFAVVDDETMTFLWETATQLDQRVSLDSETRTVREGALWLEESLPPETLLIGLLLAERSRRPSRTMTEDEVLAQVFPAKGEQLLQFGGKSTIGRGRCRMVPR